MDAVWFVFSEFIQSEVDEVRAHWNSHYIRKSTFGTVSGQPEELFFLPESFVYKHRGIQITDKDIARVLEDNFLLRAEEVIKTSDEELCNYFRCIIFHEGLNHPPTDWAGARKIFKTVLYLFCNFFDSSCYNHGGILLNRNNNS